MKSQTRLNIPSPVLSVKLFALLLPSLFVFHSLLAQPAGDRGDIEAKRIGFITNQLNLTPDEAKVFWPVYNKYQDEMETLRKGRATELLSAKINFDSMNDEAVSKLIDNEFTSRQKEIDIQRKYNTEFKKVLPIKKVAMLYRAEQLFKIMLIKEMNGGPLQQGPGDRRIRKTDIHFGKQRFRFFI